MRVCFSLTYASASGARCSVGGDGQQPWVFLAVLSHDGASVSRAKARGLGPTVLHGFMLVAEWGQGRRAPTAETQCCDGAAGGKGASKTWAASLWSGITILMSWRRGWGNLVSNTTDAHCSYQLLADFLEQTFLRLFFCFVLLERERGHK